MDWCSLFPKDLINPHIKFHNTNTPSVKRGSMLLNKWGIFKPLSDPMHSHGTAPF